MPPTTRDTQRAELHKTIWRISNDLRGSVDGWDFKSYVLGTLFYRFISENLTAYVNEQERKAGDKAFDYAALDDAKAEFGRKDTVAEKGFYILPSELFANVRKRAATDENLNMTLARVFKKIEGSAVGTGSEGDLGGLFDDLDVNSAKLGPTVAKRNEKLVKLLDAIGDLKIGDFADNSIDAFGDTYEYLMAMYASSAGKSGGEYYTPQEVSELLARITVVGKTEVNKVYDPACGSGSLLLKFAKVLGKDKVRHGFYGQEINLTAFNLARINMLLHDVKFEKFNIAHGDTLIDPRHSDDKPFEAIVSNPPYSIKWEGNANATLINDPRFAPAGVLAPKSKADLAFTMHILSWLAVDGTAAIVEFPGVLFRAGAEQKIRKYLLDNNYVDAVIQLPPDLFFGTTIATCVIVLKKSKQDNSVLFIDASTEFTRVGNKNLLAPDHQQKVLDAFVARADVKHFARLVPNNAIAENGYKLLVGSYVKQDDTREAVHIQTLNEEITRIVARQSALRTEIDAVEGSRIDDLIAQHCPDGVPFNALGGVCSLGVGTLPDKKEQGGQFAWWNGGVEPSGWVSQTNTDGDTITIPSRGSVGMVGYRSEPFWCGPLCYRIRSQRPDLLTRFLFYYLKSIQNSLVALQQTGSIPALNKKELVQVRVPIPPIEVQREIVCVLDLFTRKLDAELNAELVARRKQYEYYRDKLLTFEEAE
jgi:type I restriction enzyme M protein